MNDYYEKEEATIKKYNIPCSRINYPFQEGAPKIQGTAIFRGPKMKASAYSDFIRSMEGIGCFPFVGLDDFIRISDVLECSRCFDNYAPKAIAFDIKKMFLKFPICLLKRI